VPWPPEGPAGEELAGTGIDDLDVGDRHLVLQGAVEPGSSAESRRLTTTLAT
jgi:hypothetical protein